MELREWALTLLTGSNLSDKLTPITTWTDSTPGPALKVDRPGRAPHLRFSDAATRRKLPPFHAHHKQAARCECLHRFAGHELLAIEILAYTLLAFPTAPKGYRSSLVTHIQEEQNHLSLYVARLQALGSDFGDYPLYRHFWAHTPALTSPTHVVAFLNLTIEQANLDFAPMYRNSFLRADDIGSARLMQKILDDEILHVKRGYDWIRRWHGHDPEHLWDVWSNHLPPLMRYQQAKGFTVHEDSRYDAGLPPLWVEKLIGTDKGSVRKSRAWPCS